MPTDVDIVDVNAPEPPLIAAFPVGDTPPGEQLGGVAYEKLLDIDMESDEDVQEDPTFFPKEDEDAYMHDSDEAESAIEDSDVDSEDGESFVDLDDPDVSCRQKFFGPPLLTCVPYPA